MCSITVTLAKINRILCSSSILLMLGKLWLKYYTQEIDVENYYACLFFVFFCLFACFLACLFVCLFVHLFVLYQLELNQ